MNWRAAGAATIVGSIIWNLPLVGRVSAEKLLEIPLVSRKPVPIAQQGPRGYLPLHVAGPIDKANVFTTCFNKSNLDIHGLPANDFSMVRSIYSDPSSIRRDSSITNIVGRLDGNNERAYNSERTNQAHDCPYRCDPVKAFGGPQLSTSKILFSSAVLFVAFMYLSDKGLERRPFGVQHVFSWMLAVLAGCLVLLSGIPMGLRAVWSFL